MNQSPFGTSSLPQLLLYRLHFLYLINVEIQHFNMQLIWILRAGSMTVKHLNSWNRNWGTTDDNCINAHPAIKKQHPIDYLSSSWWEKEHLFIYIYMASLDFSLCDFQFKFSIHFSVGLSSHISCVDTNFCQLYSLQFFPVSSTSFNLLMVSLVV